jgi:hypothetical protein
VSSPVEPLFAPLTLVGLLILLYIVIQLIHVLIIIGPRPTSTPSMAEIEARRRVLGKVLPRCSSGRGCSCLTALRGSLCLFKETICVFSRDQWSRSCSLPVVG